MAWFREAKAASWTRPQDVRDLYGCASIIADNRVVFNISGNKYRLVVKMNYDYEIAYIRFIGTHTDYDRIDAETV